MTLYKEEKKRIGNMRWGIIVILLAFNLIYYQAQAGNSDSGIITYDVETFGIIGLIVYLNHRLFYIKERGKNIFIMKKYEILPIKKTTWYLVKVGIIAEQVAVFIAGSIGIYLFTVFVNKNVSIDPNFGSGIWFSVEFAAAFLLATVVVIDFKWGRG